MFNKIKVLLIAFCMLFSNVAFSATSAYCFVLQSDFNNGTKIDIVKQYRGIVNMPKVFCDICVELTKEIIHIGYKDKNNSNINKEYVPNEIVGNFYQAKYNNKKQNFINNGDKNFYVTLNKEKSGLTLFAENITYYITDYIGLLHANDLINNVVLTKNIYFKTLFVV